MSIIELPRLVGTREAAKHLVEANVDLDTTEVTLYARAVLSAAPSFLDELVTDLDRRGVTRLQLVGASDALYNELRERATAHHSDLEVVTASA